MYLSYFQPHLNRRWSQEHQGLILRSEFLQSFWYACASSSCFKVNAAHTEKKKKRKQASVFDELTLHRGTLQK